MATTEFILQSLEFDFTERSLIQKWIKNFKKNQKRRIKKASTLLGINNLNSHDLSSAQVRNLSDIVFMLHAKKLLDQTVVGFLAKVLDKLPILHQIIAALNVDNQLTKTNLDRLQLEEIKDDGNSSCLGVLKYIFWYLDYQRIMSNKNIILLFKNFDYLHDIDMFFSGLHGVWIQQSHFEKIIKNIVYIQSIQDGLNQLKKEQCWIDEYIEQVIVAGKEAKIKAAEIVNLCKKEQEANQDNFLSKVCRIL